ncbi:MAG: tRNA (adenosine(37)-N6)-threonylcarbamoyltransferase complex ATPase subunit type 1 TsaE [Actinomycetota bacterium]
MKIHTASVERTRALADALASLLVAGDIVLLIGDVGAGKTSFAQGLARGLGVIEPVTSPSFTIVHEYGGRLPVVHIDVYRLDRLQELYDIGIEELVDSGRVTMVEWGDVVAQILPTEHLAVRIDLGASDDERGFTLECSGTRWHGRRRAMEVILTEFGEDEGQ